jgi:hypothetical protein
MTWAELIHDRPFLAGVAAITLSVTLVLVLVCGGAKVHVDGRPAPAEGYPACLARCEDVLDPDHRPAGWVVIDPDPCTCGVVLEVRK